MKNTKKYLSLFLVLTTILSSTIVFCVNATELLGETDIDVIETEDVVIEHELVPMMARGCDYTSVNQMQHLINIGKAPSSVTHVHNGFQGQQPHVHFSDGTAMNFDGSSHHGNPNPSVSTMRWLNSHGWCIS